MAEMCRGFGRYSHRRVSRHARQAERLNRDVRQAIIAPRAIAVASQMKHTGASSGFFSWYAVVRAVSASRPTIGASSMRMLASFIMLLAAGPAFAIDCHVAMPAERSGKWSWRLIDGRQCWYQGERGLPKSELRWPPEEEQEPEPTPTVDDPIEHSDEDEHLLESYWPDVGSMPMTFEDRWPNSQWRR
jgi:hypothetical protein